MPTVTGAQLPSTEDGTDVPFASNPALSMNGKDSQPQLFAELIGRSELRHDLKKEVGSGDATAEKETLVESTFRTERKRSRDAEDDPIACGSISGSHKRFRG